VALESRTAEAESSSTTALGLGFVSFGHEIFDILINVYI